MVGKIIRVSYRENGTDYARSCVVGQTNSAHEIAEHDNIEDAAVAGLKLNLRDYRRGYGDWDHTVIWCGPLADMPESMRRGWEPDDEWEPDRHVDLTQLPEYKAAHAEAKRQIAEEQEREQRRRQREAERQEQREQAAKRSRDLAELQRLKEKYPEAT